jgi:hypothetical protein
MERIQFFIIVLRSWPFVILSRRHQVWTLAVLWIFQRKCKYGTVKLQLSLCTLWWHTDPRIPNLYNKWRGVVRFTPQPDWYRVRLFVTNRIVDWVGPGAGLHILEILGIWSWNKNIALTRLCPKYTGYIQFSVLYFDKITLITVTIPWWW